MRYKPVLHSEGVTSIVRSFTPAYHILEMLPSPVDNGEKCSFKFPKGSLGDGIEKSEN